MRRLAPKYVLWPGLWSLMLLIAFALACNAATDDIVTQADIDMIVETAVAAAVPSIPPIASGDIEVTVATAVEATVAAAMDNDIESAEAELELIIEATVEAAVQATVVAIPTPTPSLSGGTKRVWSTCRRAAFVTL